MFACLLDLLSLDKTASIKCIEPNCCMRLDKHGCFCFFSKNSATLVHGTWLALQLISINLSSHVLLISFSRSKSVCHTTKGQSYASWSGDNGILAFVFILIFASSMFSGALWDVTGWFKTFIWKYNGLLFVPIMH